jgi:AmiR/NasT family two-component response regulator
MRQLRILFAAGKQHVRDHFLSLFTSARYQAVAAEDGKQLAELCRSFRPDVIVADEQLPDGPGLVAATAIARECQAAVIVLAEKVEPSLLRQLDEEPLLSGCLLKPVNCAELEAAARIAARRSRELRAAAPAAEPAADGQLLQSAERVLMKRAGVNAEEAQRRLHDLAAARGLGPSELARIILNAEDAFAFAAKPPDARAAGRLGHPVPPHQKTSLSRPHAGREVRASGAASAPPP